MAVYQQMCFEHANLKKIRLHSNKLDKTAESLYAYFEQYEAGDGKYICNFYNLKTIDVAITIIYVVICVFFLLLLCCKRQKNNTREHYGTIILLEEL